MDILFDDIIVEVDRLRTYRHWLPIERRQISFYCEKLRSLSKQFQHFAIRHEDYLSELSTRPPLHSLVCEIIESKPATTRRPFEARDLLCVGNRLAFEVSAIYKSCTKHFGKPEDECDFQDFASHFYFDRKKFQRSKRKVFIGFQVEASNLLQQLTSITKKQLQVISIVGMAGLGKTTLARRLYNDSYVLSYFYVRAWVTCSQVYRKTDLLLSILKSVSKVTDEVSRMDDNMLSHHLYRSLMGQRYLIVIDDIWSNEAWDDFRRSFPNDNNGSRIMITTRLKDVALHAQPDGNPLCLRFLTEAESFDLFKRKALVRKTFFEKLSSIGKIITSKCRGLPLAIVVIAGLLKNNFHRDWWAQVAENVSSCIVDENQYVNTLALSYNHLPQHLKPCFLSFGAFPEDHDIPVQKLLWLWIAEGFINMDGTKKKLENVAEDYLTDLIRRNLVVVGKKGSNDAIKTCSIHDHLRDLCLREVEEQNFSQDAYRHNKHSFSCSHSSTNPSTKCQLLLSTNRVQNIRSKCSCYSSEVSHLFFKDVSIVWDPSQLITALDISSIEFYVFPSELLQLIHLRYLELRFRAGDTPESLCQLTELQTLIMSSRMNIAVSESMWKMKNLRHLYIKSGENLVKIPSDEEELSLLENLQTLSLVSPTRPCQNILTRTRNLKKLGLCGPLTTKIGEFKCPDLGLLLQLETLKLLNTVPLRKPGRLSESILFPESLKSLSLLNTYLDWKEAWVFGMIPNLVVLKLKFHAFVGKDWKTSPEAFPRLKFLKLDELDIVTWKSSRNHFPLLQRLQVHRCPYLMGIPKDFGNICTLELIELSRCSKAATRSARSIRKEQKSNGNDWPKILLGPGLAEPMHETTHRSTWKSSTKKRKRSR